MDTQTLYCCLKLVTRGKHVKSINVIPRDFVNSVNTNVLPYALIVNTDDSSKPGTHWLAFYIYRDRGVPIADYFDSYGNSLDEYGIQFPIPLNYFSGRVIQSYDTKVCGLHCLKFIYYRCRGYSMSRFIGTYTADSVLNDVLVEHFYGRLLRRKRTLKESDRNTQKCCSRRINNF
jgi:hypothetical protein